MKKIIFLLILALSAVAFSGHFFPSLAKPVLLHEAFTRVPVGQVMEYLVDPGGRLSIDDVRGGTCAGRWERSSNDGPGFGFSNDVYWVRVTVENTTAYGFEFYLEQAYPLIDNIRLYAPGRTGFRVTEVGRLKPFNERPFNYRTFVFPVTLGAGETATYYLRYQTTSSMNLVLVIWSPAAFDEAKTTEQYMLAIFYSVILMIIVYNLFLFFIIRWLEFLYFFLWGGLYLVFMAALNGTAFEFLWPDSPRWASFCVPVILCVMFFFIVIFCAEVVALRADRDRFRYRDIVYKLMAAIECLIAVLFVACFFIPYRYAMLSTTLMAGMALVAISIMGLVLIFKERNRQAVFGLAAFMPIMVGAMTFVFKTLSLVPTNFFTEWAVHIGSVFMAILCSIVLADKVNTIRKELAVMNVSLEQKVDDRTKMLHQANEELEVINDSLMRTNSDLAEAQRIARLDMEMAVQVQRTLLPGAPPRPRGWDIALAFRPMAGISGDIYDFYTSDDDLEGLAIFDVSGHGIASGLITMIARSVFHRHFTRGRLLPLSRVIHNANQDLITEIGKVDNYLTGILLRFAGDMVEYVNAAHSDLVVRREGSGTVEIVNMPDRDVKGLFLGAMGVDLPYEQMRFPLSPGDMLLLYTDCLYEEKDRHGEQYGMERLVASFRDAPSAPAQQVLDFVLKQFHDFVGSVRLRDDLTVIVLKKS